MAAAKTLSLRPFRAQSAQPPEQLPGRRPAAVRRPVRRGPAGPASASAAGRRPVDERRRARSSAAARRRAAARASARCACSRRTRWRSISLRRSSAARMGSASMLAQDLADVHFLPQPGAVAGDAAAGLDRVAQVLGQRHRRRAPPAGSSTRSEPRSRRSRSWRFSSLLLGPSSTRPSTSCGVAHPASANRDASTRGREARPLLECSPSSRHGCRAIHMAPPTVPRA